MDGTLKHELITPQTPGAQDAHHNFYIGCRSDIGMQCRQARYNDLRVYHKYKEAGFTQYLMDLGTSSANLSSTLSTLA